MVAATIPPCAQLVSCEWQSQLTYAFPTSAGQFDVWNIFLGKTVGQLGLNISLKVGSRVGHKPEGLQHVVAHQQLHEQTAAPVHSPRHEATETQHAQHALVQSQGQSDLHDALAHKQPWSGLPQRAVACRTRFYTYTYG